MSNVAGLNNVNNIPQTDTTSDVAGAANVNPSYIAAEVPTAFAIEESTGIDGVSVSTSVTPTQTASIGGSLEAKETTGYIVSDVTSETTFQPATSAIDQYLDGYDMNSLSEVANSFAYIEPDSDAMKGILNDLKAQGLITDGMSEEDLINVINGYIATNYTYSSEATGDNWQTVNETINLKTGDCEDFANLEASLLIAALMDRGVSRAEADSRINCLVSISPTGLVGHVWVKYTGEDGSTVYLNPAARKVSSEIPANQMAIFSYNATSVNVISDYDYTKLITASYDVDTTPTVYIKTDYAKLYQIQRATRDAAQKFKTAIDAVISAVSSWKGFFGTRSQWYVLVNGHNPPSGTMFAADFVRKSGFEAPNGGFTGLNHMDFYTALSGLSNGLTGNIFQDKYTVDNVLSVINSMIALYGNNAANNATYSSGNIPLSNALNTLKTVANNYYSLVVGGIASCNSETTSFIDYVVGMLNGYEMQAWDLNLEVMKASMAAEVLSADASIAKANATLASYNYTVSSATNLTKGLASAWTLDQLKASDSTTKYCVHGWNAVDKRWEYFMKFSDSELDDLKYKVENWYSKYTYIEWDNVHNIYSYKYTKDVLVPAATAAVTKATTDKDLLITNFRNYFNIPLGTAGDAEYNEMMNTVKTSYLDSEVVSGYTFYTVKWDNPLFAYQQSTDYTNSDTNWDKSLPGESWENALNPSIPMQVSLVKGMMIIISLLYETRRDLRGLVEKELTGEENDYKPMQINKLFAKKCDKLEKSLQSAVANILKAMNNFNQASETSQSTAINKKYDESIAGIDEPDMCEADTSEKDTANYNVARDGELKAVDTYVKGIEEQNLAMAKSMLETTGMSISGTSSDEIWNSLNSQVDGVLNNLGSIIKFTKSDEDDPAYQEIDWEQRDALRGQLLGAFAMRRAVLAADQAKSDMRNLAHQEMTGIGGRSARTDIASDQLENDGQQVLNWFDATVDSTEQIVKLKNNIRYAELDIEKNKELLKKIAEQEAARGWASGLGWLASACGIVGIFFWPFLIAAAVIGVASAVITATQNADLAYTRKELEKTYGTKMAIVVDDTKHKTPTVNIDTDDAALQLAADAETSISDIFSNFTSSNYVKDVGDAYSIFDSAKFAAQAENVRDLNLQIMIAQAAKQTINEMRSLTHMEMTGIANRSPSNMANYGMEAARGQQAIVMNGAFTNLSDVNQTSNAKKDLKLRLDYLTKLYENANNSLNWSYVPLIGNSVGAITSGLNDLHAQKGDAESRAKGSYTTDATFTDETLNNILANGTTDAGDGNKMVDAGAIATARTQYTKAFVAVSVEASIRKLMREVRSLTHQEMTGIRSGIGGELSDQANALNFETAMRSLNMISNYLQQKTQIDNKINDATQNLKNINDQISKSEAGAWVSGAFAVVAAVVSIWIGPAASSVFQVAIAATQAASSMASLVWSITGAIKAYYNYQHYAGMKNDMPDIQQTLAKLRAAVQDNANSVEGSIEALEQQAIEEIANMLVGSSIGGGAIGINRGQASAYKNIIDKLYKQQKIQNNVAKTLSDLRALIHENMTGISAASMNATSNVLNINQESIKAQIDTMFDGLQSLVDRFNQINDTKRQAEIAKIRAQSAAISAVIETAVFVIQQILTYASKAQAANKAEQNVDLAETNGTWKGATGDTPETAIAPDEKLDKISALKADSSVKAQAYNEFASPYNYALTALNVVDVLSKVAVAYYEKAATENVDKKLKAETDAKFGTVAQSSEVIAAEVGTGDFDQMAAYNEVEAGKAELDSQISQNTTIKQLEIDKQFDSTIKSIQKDLVMNKTQEVVSFVKGLVPKDKTSVYPSKGTLENILVQAGVPLDAAKKMSEAVSAKMQTLANEKDPKLLKAGVEELMAQMKVLINQFKPEAPKPSANMSAMQGRIDALMEAISGKSGLEAQIKTAEAANLPQDTIQTLKDKMEGLKAQLAKEKAALSDIKTSIKKMTERDIPEAQAQIKKYEEERDQAYYDLSKLYTDLGAQLIGLQECMDRQTEPQMKEVLERRMGEVKETMVKARVAFETADAKFRIGEGTLAVMAGHVKELEAKKDEQGKTIDFLTREIKGVLDKIRKQGPASVNVQVDPVRDQMMAKMKGNRGKGK